MSIVQLIECSNCGHTESIPDEQRNKMPWEIWQNGCPKCGSKTVDLTIVLDRSGKVKDIKKGELKT